VTESLANEKPQGEEPIFTNRELNILQLLGKGYNNAQIGKELFVSERIVRYHIGRIIYRLGVHNRTEAVAIALKNGMIQL
jgi:DNA-binding NarL/FixJ family response regulator